MHGRCGKNAPTSAGNVPWVCTRVIEAAASLEIPPRAVPQDSGRIGLHWGPGACTFLGHDSP